MLPSTMIEVPVQTLDSFSLGRVDGIKIDVEDHEYHVLNGARRLIERHRPIILSELWETENRTRTLELMRSLDYSSTQKSDISFLFLPNA
jgi:hypothetical protein